MLRLTSKINISSKSSNFKQGYDFDFVHECEITNCFENLTDTCKIMMPRNIKLDGKDLVIGEDSVFNVGDKVKIELGYDENYKTAFVGYITNLGLNLPFEIECEDSSWLLKKNVLNKLFNYSKVSLSDLIKDIMPSGIEYKLDFDITNLGALRIAKTETTASVLEYLRKKHNVMSYFVEEVLHLFIGGEYKVQNRIDHVFDFENNIIDNDLKYQKEGDLKLRVKYVCNYDDTNDKGKLVKKKRIAWYPSENAEGSVKSLELPGNYSQKDLDKMAKDLYDKSAYEGYKGGFTTFGAPFVKATDGVQLQSAKLPERNNGLYLVKKVVRTFGINGYRQKIEIANRIVF